MDAAAEAYAAAEARARRQAERDAVLAGLAEQREVEKEALVVAAAAGNRRVTAAVGTDE